MPFYNNKFENWLVQIGLLLTILIVYWSPFSGGARPIVLLLAILGIVYIVKNGKQFFLVPAIQRWNYVFLLLWLPMWTSLLNSYDQKSTLVAIAWFPLFYLAGLALIQVLKHPQSRLWFARAMVLLIGIWSVDSAVQYLQGYDVIGRLLTPDGRVTGMFEDLHQGIILLTVLPVACYYFLTNKQFLLAIVLLLVAGLLMALSGSRGYLYILILIIIGMVMHQRYSLTKSFALLAIPVLIVFASYQLSHQLIATKIATTETVTQSNLSTYDKINVALSYRLDLWATGAHMFLDQPITGIGTKNFKRAYPNYSSREGDPFAKNGVHSHNIYVELLAETGLIGLSGLVAIMYFFRRWYKQSSEMSKAQSWPYALALMAIFFPINTTQPMMVPWWFPHLLLLACGFIASLDSQNQAKA